MNSNTPDVRYSALVESLPGFVFIFDDEFILRDVWLPSSMQLFHSMRELIGMHGSVIYSPEVCEVLLDNIRGCLQDGQLREVEYPVYLKNLRFYYQARIVPYKDNMVLALIQDIGDRVRRIEELMEVKHREESNQMKSAFLANMSHEIRTPLNAIVGFSEILAEEEDPELKAEFIGIIRKNSDLLLQLINDILDISRIESGKLQIHNRLTDVNALLHEVGEVHQLRMRPEVEFIVRMPKDKVVTYTDPNRIKQILHNFLSNAVKHTQEGSITLRLVAEENRSLTFSVTDTGSGIDAEKLPYVFDRFEKLNTFVQGTGLGLAITKSLVTFMGGTIAAESTLGEGSTFSFNIPIRDTQEAADAVISDHNKSKAAGASNTGGKKKILVAEPTEGDFIPIQALLAKEYQIIRAVTEEEVKAAYFEQDPNLVIINISEPSLPAVELIKMIRTHSSFVPIIALTTHGNYIDQEYALKAGTNDVVLKPYSTSRLQDAVVAYI